MASDWVVIAKDKDEAVEKLARHYEAEPLGMYDVEEITKKHPSWKLGEKLD